MKTELNFIFTPDALDEAQRAGMQSARWLTGDIAPPIAGDLVSFGDDPAPVFEVRNRLFIWRGTDHVVLQLLLGPAPGQSGAPAAG